MDKEVPQRKEVKPGGAPSQVKSRTLACSRRLTASAPPSLRLPGAAEALR
jgi:hypothetical protein